MTAKSLHSEKKMSSPVPDGLTPFAPLAALFRTLGEPLHLQLFWLLCHQEADAAGLASLLNRAEAEIAMPLVKLCGCGLVTSRQEHGSTLFKASPSPAGQQLHELVETLLNVLCPGAAPASLMERIHAYLMAHLDRHITIEELSEQFFVNPTTLKEGFKAVYGTSLAAHVKEHRMHEAARLLRSTDDSIAVIARAVGYTSQSRFSAAFKEQYHQLPRDYRKK